MGIALSIVAVLAQTALRGTQKAISITGFLAVAAVTQALPIMTNAATTLIKGGWNMMAKGFVALGTGSLKKLQRLRTERTDKDKGRAAKIAVEKKAAEEQTASIAACWKKAAEKQATQQQDTVIAAHWKQLAEALKLNEEGLKLFREGKFKEGTKEIESALDKYVEAVSKFNNAAKKKALDVIFNSFIMVIDALIKQEAYDEAQETINYAKTHFPQHNAAFTEAERMINSHVWSPDYERQNLIKLDQELSVDNIIKLSEGC
ncbi:unnamed protein product [Didymodactylos carnosus]|nr:unnamed protein product [Didymodactylos carnosus]CAF4367880.1 unnamed protein product [Didymodactylos carnosus]